MATDKVTYWLDIADYDLDTAEAMYQTGRWLYVAFMCHQCIEKTLKAYWCATQPNDPPYTHNHMRLSEGSGLYDQMDNGQRLYSLHKEQYIDMVQKAVNDARAEGADHVILLSHVGETYSEQTATSPALIAATYGIDIVLDGHSHNVVDTILTNSKGEKIPLVNTGTAFQNIGYLWLGANGERRIRLIPISEVTQISPSVENEVQRIKTVVNDRTGSIIAHSDFPLLITDGNGQRMVRKAETNAGDLVADAMRRFVGAQIGLTNGGGIRNDIPAGDISYGDIISLTPFDNRVIKITVSGTLIKDMLQEVTLSLPEENGQFPQISGLRFTVRQADHAVSDIAVLQPDSSFSPLIENATYTIGCTDYMLSSNYFPASDTYPAPTVITQTNTICYDALAAYLRDSLKGSIPASYAHPQNRITIIP